MADQGVLFTGLEEDAPVPKYRKQGALIPLPGFYRYRLWRVWDPALTKAGWIGFNPSVANAEKDDATVRRFVGYAQRWGHGGIEVVNIFPRISTDPAFLHSVNLTPALDTAPFGIRGEGNDEHIMDALRECRLVLAAWGGLGKEWQAEVDRVLDLVTRFYNVYCVKVNADGSPYHPSRGAYVLDKPLYRAVQTPPKPEET